MPTIINTFFELSTTQVSLRASRIQTSSKGDFLSYLYTIPGIHDKEELNNAAWAIAIIVVVSILLLLAKSILSIPVYIILVSCQVSLSTKATLVILFDRTFGRREGEGRLDGVSSVVDAWKTYDTNFGYRLARINFTSTVLQSWCLPLLLL